MLKRIIVNEVIKALASHKTTIHEDCIKDIYLKKNDVLRHIHSGNHVIQTTTGFFRFCPLHTERNNYNRNRLHYHLSTLPFDPSDMLFLESFFRSDVNLSDFIQFCSSRRFTDNNYTNFSEKISLSGIVSYLPANKDEFDKNLYDLAYGISADISQYATNRYNSIPQTFSANRILAQEALANLLGIEYMFPKTEFVNLHIEEQPVSFGIMMSASKGIYPLKLGDRMTESITPSLQRELIMLNIHDVICNEKDHRPGNYHVIMDDSGSKVLHLSVFDNDCRWTFFPSCHLNIRTYSGTSHLLDRNGVIARPYIDRKFAEKVQSISKNEFYEHLGPYLNKLQLAASYSKIVALGNAINRTTRNRVDWLLEEDDWSESTIREELSGKYGNTYLSVYYHWYNRMLKEHPEIFNSYNLNMSD